MLTNADRVAQTVDLDEVRIYRPPDAARLLGLTPSTLAKLRMRGDGPVFVRMSCRAVGYRRGDLVRWIAERVATSTSAPGVRA